ncbi:MAG: hypothetical protein ACJ0BN_18675 [Limisphaerales bacterium]|nr:hypothetical protein [Verrucomicrobiales bacterium]HCP39354.1 hypothetical protein [Verrucomicrobiales bacterium]
MSAESPKRTISAFGNHQVMPPRSSHGYFGVCFKRPIIDDSGQRPLTLTILAIGNWVKASSEERCIVK